MADVKISQLDNGSALAGSEYVAIVQNGQTVKTTAGDIAALAGAPTLITKSITDNGTYYASSDGADGYSSVSVTVSGGGSSYDLILEQEQYSHVAAFDSIALPADYTDYTHLVMFLTQTSADKTLLEDVYPGLIDYYIANNTVPNQLMFVIPTADITPSDQNVQIPVLDGSKILFGIWGQTKINSSRILGYNYGWPWQIMYLYAYGINI